MPKLFLLCGLPGSGKTTRAKEIERDASALRLTPDDWMHRLHFDGYDETARARVEALQWDVAARALQLGMNVVLDFGLWSKQERDDFRAHAKALGAETELRFLDVPRYELLRRLKVRNAASPPGTFPVEEAHLDEWSGIFQPPSAEELA
ncbi:MAG: AAA family ATPase [Alphaproteobacteria bacterium]